MVNYAMRTFIEHKIQQDRYNWGGKKTKTDRCCQLN